MNHEPVHQPPAQAVEPGLAATKAGAMVSPLHITGLIWDVTITDSQMTIGCKSHSLHECEAFSDMEIGEMGRHALDFWSTNKALLIGMARANGRCFDRVRETAESSEVKS